MLKSQVDEIVQLRLSYRNEKALERHRIKNTASQSVDQSRKQRNKQSLHFDYTSKLVNKFYEDSKNKKKSVNLTAMLGLNINKSIVSREMESLYKEIKSFHTTQKKVNTHFRNEFYIKYQHYSDIITSFKNDYSVSKNTVQTYWSKPYSEFLSYKEMFVYYGILNKEDNYVYHNIQVNLAEILHDYNKKLDSYSQNTLSDVNTIITENFLTYLCLLQLLEQDTNFYVDLFKSIYTAYENLRKTEVYHNLFPNHEDTKVLSDLKAIHEYQRIVMDEDFDLNAPVINANKLNLFILHKYYGGFDTEERRPMVESFWKDKLSGDTYDIMNQFVGMLRDKMKAISGRVGSIEVSSVENMLKTLEKHIYSLPERDEEEYKRIFLIRNYFKVKVFLDSHKVHKLIATINHDMDCFQPCHFRILDIKTNWDVLKDNGNIRTTNIKIYVFEKKSELFLKISIVDTRYNILKPYLQLYRWLLNNNNKMYRYFVNPSIYEPYRLLRTDADLFRMIYHNHKNNDNLVMRYFDDDIQKYTKFLHSIKKNYEFKYYKIYINEIVKFNLEYLQNQYNTFEYFDINHIQPYNLPIINLLRDIGIVTWNTYIPLYKIVKDYMTKKKMKLISINELNIFARYIYYNQNTDITDYSLKSLSVMNLNYNFFNFEDTPRILYSFSAATQKVKDLTLKFRFFIQYYYALLEELFQYNQFIVQNMYIANKLNMYFKDNNILDNVREYFRQQFKFINLSDTYRSRYLEDNNKFTYISIDDLGGDLKPMHSYIMDWYDGRVDFKTYEQFCYQKSLDNINDLKYFYDIKINNVNKQIRNIRDNIKSTRASNQDLEKTIQSNKYKLSQVNQDIDDYILRSDEEIVKLNALLNRQKEIMCISETELYLVEKNYHDEGDYKAIKENHGKIDFSDQDLDTLDDLHFKLRNLYIDNNELTSSALDVSELQFVQYINLSNNLLTDIAQFSDTKLPHLIELDLTQNEIKETDQLISYSLCILRVAKNKIENMNFNGCSSLKVLDVSNNKLSSFNTCRIRKVTELYMSNNQLTELILPNDNLEYLDDLQILDVSYNNITKVQYSNRIQIESVQQSIDNSSNNQSSKANVNDEKHENHKSLANLSSAHPSQLAKLSSAQQSQLDIKLKSNASLKDIGENVELFNPEDVIDDLPKIDLENIKFEFQILNLEGNLFKTIDDISLIFHDSVSIKNLNMRNTPLLEYAYYNDYMEREYLFKLEFTLFLDICKKVKGITILNEESVQDNLDMFIKQEEDEKERKERMANVKVKGKTNNPILDMLNDEMEQKKKKQREQNKEFDKFI